MPINIEDILTSQELTIDQKITELSNKTVNVRPWNELEKEYYPKHHWVMDKAKYPDIVGDERIQVSRIPIDLQRLAAKRMTQMTVGIPVKRKYSPQNDNQNKIASYIEKIMDKNRIDSFNIERLNMLFAGCEVMTLWYAIAQPNNSYGFNSKLKLRCRNFSPMKGDELYPLFDEYGDMVALSVAYTRMDKGKSIRFYDAYTALRHVKYSMEGGEWKEVENEDISSIGKIPAIYMSRPTPIWEDLTPLVDETEKSLSRNGNYLRENSKPVFAVFANSAVDYGKSKGPDEGGKDILQLPQGANAGYLTWAQSIESLKFQYSTLRSIFFTQLQLPDWNYEKMSQQAMSGESRKQLFIDVKLKVTEESGPIKEGFDREINVLRQFLKQALPNSMASDIDALPVEQIITPFQIGDDKETISNLLLANGNKPIMSQRESIETYGKSDDIDKTMLEISSENKQDVFEPTE